MPEMWVQNDKSERGQDMTREEAVKHTAIEVLKENPCEDEIILTKEEYGQLLSNEFDNGYAKGYREALEQEDSILDKIKAEIEQIEINGYIRDVECFRAGINVALNVIDKYKAGSEV